MNGWKVGKTINNLLRAAARGVGVVFVCALLGACGGGGGGGGGNVVSVEPDLPDNATLTVTAAEADNGGYVSSAEFSMQSGLAAIKAEGAYERGYWGQGVTVAVVDNGISTVHGEFEGQIVPVNLNIPHWHGTFVAGIIGARRDGSVNADNQGMHGVAPSVKLMPLLNGGGGFDAFRRAAAANVPILNNSWGHTWEFSGYYKSDGAASVSLHFTGPVLQNFLDIPEMATVRGFRNGMRYFADVMRRKDMVAVWAAGNEYWNENTSVYVRDPGMVTNTMTVNMTVTDNMNTMTTTMTVTNTNAVTVISTLAQAYVISNFVAVQKLAGNTTITVALSQGTVVTFNNNTLTISAFDANGADSYSWAPRYHPDLLGKWLAVVAVDIRNNNTAIASFSNGCGETKHWCLAAPGVSIYSTGNPTAKNPAGYGAGDGTSFAAPHVSGALALLKSRYPQMPMAVIVDILLNAAVKIGNGTTEVDDVYGHGMLNVANAITIQDGATLVIPRALCNGSNCAPTATATVIINTTAPPAGGMALPRAKAKLPRLFAGFENQLRDVKAAVRYLGDRYYDAPVEFDIAPRASSSPMIAVDNLWGGVGGGGNIKNGAKPSSNFFALKDDGGVLRAAGGKWRALEVRHNWFGETPVWGEYDDADARPFFFNAKGGRSAEVKFNFGGVGVFAARGKEEEVDYNQFGFRLQKSSGRFNFASSFSHIREENTFLGAKFGGAMPLQNGGATQQTQMRAAMRLNGLFNIFDDNAGSGKWQIFGAYQHARASAKLGGLIAQMSDLRARGWRAGLSGAGVFNGGDIVRFAVGEETAITGGNIILRYARAANPQVDADTKIKINRAFQTTQRVIKPSPQTPLTFSAAYGFRPAQKSRLSFGITRTTTSQTKAAITYRLNF